ncbi:hypothetical protein [Lactobacillus delbrueckii]|uniref:hypothetical protein n=1 Tax=Lactobacillus delbrueckii TaxID=1584 RepID=UPI00177B0FF6|nr:hypothetical protein [Lactobacillus delbrueckii]MBD5834701.1 hypothetical protein [Lactobacillus delbrueckii]
MSYSMTLSDGTKLDNLALNGNNFISSVKVTEDDFKDKLSKVTITDDDGKATDYTDMVLVQLTQVGDESWFILGEKAQDDVSKLQAAVATLTDMVMQGGGF